MEKLGSTKINSKRTKILVCAWNLKKILADVYLGNWKLNSLDKMQCSRTSKRLKKFQIKVYICNTA